MYCLVCCCASISALIASAQLTAFLYRQVLGNPLSVHIEGVLICNLFHSEYSFALDCLLCSTKTTRPNAQFFLQNLLSVGLFPMIFLKRAWLRDASHFVYWLAGSLLDAIAIYKEKRAMQVEDFYPNFPILLSRCQDKLQL